MTQLLLPSDTASIDVEPFRVFVGRIKPGAMPANDPTWGTFTESKLLKVHDLYKGSSFGGPSHATVQLAVGAPITDGNTRVEHYNVIGQGDRVAIGIGRGTAIRWLWAGYMTSVRLYADPKREQIVFRMRGPEWIWGDRQGEGARKSVVGQIRRAASADDAWYGSIFSPTTAFSDMKSFTAQRCVFNPDGQKNMTTVNVELNSNADEGRAFKFHDRRRGGDVGDYTSFWTIDQAVNTLLLWYNDPAATGIANPSIGDIQAVMGTDQTLRHVDVDGLGLWGALRKVLGPDYGMFVDPVPSGDGSNAPTFTGFKLKFFQRGMGSAASITMNPFGTAASKAKPGVTRIEAAKDVQNCVNAVDVLGSQLTHVKLMYWGDKTSTLTGAQKKTTLQHGWGKADGVLSKYSVNDQAGNAQIDPVAIQSLDTAGATDDWLNKFSSSGNDYQAHRHVFRLFTWNEAGEFHASAAPGQPVYGQAETEVDWWLPDLTGIADGTGANAGIYARQRRPLLDTAYLEGLDAWRRVPPTLFLAAIAPLGDTQGPWVEASRGHYHVDHDRAAVWITHRDLSEYYPFKDFATPDADTITDERSFATLLYTGKLRMMLIGTVNTDFALTESAAPTGTSGLALVRNATFRNARDFIRTNDFSDGVSSPVTLTETVVDTSDDAMNLASQYQNAGQDQAVHASILLTADATPPDIGSIITTFSGRSISLTGDAGGSRGAQVVALAADGQLLHWEVVTYSSAVRLKKSAKRKLRMKHKSSRGELGRTVENYQMIMPRAGEDNSSSSTGGDF